MTQWSSRIATMYAAATDRCGRGRLPRSVSQPMRAQRASGGEGQRENHGFPRYLKPRRLGGQ